MKTYREYAMENGHTEEEIEMFVGGLFGADVPMDKIIETTPAHTAYNMGNGYILYSNNSSADVVMSVDEDGNEIESWILE